MLKKEKKLSSKDPDLSWKNAPSGSENSTVQVLFTHYLLQLWIEAGFI